MVIIKDSEFAGKRVILEDASDVGAVNDIFVDTLDWRITKFDIKLEKRYAERVGVEKGILRKPIIHVPIHLLKSVGDVVHLRGGVDDLAKTQKTVLPAAERKKMEKAEKAGKAAPKPAPKPAPKTPPRKTAPPPPPPPKRDRPRSL